MNSIKKKIEESLRKVEKWIENHDYKGYEPFDGLSTYLRPLTLNNLLAERILQQLVKQSPINIRPLLGIRPQESTKASGYMAWGYLNMYKLTGLSRYKKRAIDLLSWLDKNKSPYYRHHSWGNHFDFSGRKVRTKKLEPIIVWTSLIGQAYLDAYEILDNKNYLHIAQSVCKWILGLPREKTKTGTCLSYIAFKQVSIHNSNMLGAAILARTGKIVSDSTYLEIAHQAMEYSCSRQRVDGSWYYGESDNCQWIDNFHTGYNLDSLKCFIGTTGITSYRNNLTRGFMYFKDNFFKENGIPKYYHNKIYPIDIQCAAQSIDTLATFSEIDESSMSLAINVAIWTIQNMQDPDGHFYYRILPFTKMKIPMLHWGQATMYKALTNLLLRL